MSSSPVRLVTALLAAGALVLTGCGDDDDGAAPLTTAPADDDGAVGEPDDEDSQTDTTDVPPDEVVPESNRALVNGDFADGDIRLLLTEDAACAIPPIESAGDEAAAEVEGETAEGDRFSLDWSVDDGTLRSEVELDGVVWTAEEDLSDTDFSDVEDPVIELTRNGEVLLETTYESEDGQETEALLYVNCQPEAVD